MLQHMIGQATMPQFASSVAFHPKQRGHRLICWQLHMVWCLR
jgi:hypothetical protein